MTTQQHDTAALTDEQLEGVAGGIIPEPSLRVNMRVGPVSVQPLPSPSPRSWFTRAGYVGVVGEPGLVW